MKPLVLIGASTRAAAFSALRGGYQPFCADLFADADLAQRCTVRRVEQYPRDLATAIGDYSRAPWLYTGGLENHPALVDDIAATRPLLGNAGAVLSSVRDPWKLQEALQGTACLFPELCRTADGLPRDGSWLRKGFRSAGGHQVAFWTGDDAETVSDMHYFQRRIHGRCIAALYVAANGRSRLLGITEQLLSGFRYAGSLGPIVLDDLQRATIVELGERLANRFALTGLFGVDLVLADDGVYAIEVNPRYPASAEILERASGFSAVQVHVAACREGELPTSNFSREPGYFGKTILFARQPCMAHDGFVHEASACFQKAVWPPIADVPPGGSTIASGWPVMTVFARAESLPALRQELDATIERWRALIGA